MKYILIYCILFLSFSVYGGDTIHIKFNNVSYSKELPTTYIDAIKTIHDMTFLFNSYDTTYHILDSVHQSLKKSVDTLTTQVTIFVDSITTLTEKIDSLNTIISSDAENISKNMKIYSTVIKAAIDRIPVKPIFNFGIAIGYSGFNGYVSDFSASPILMYENFLFKIDFGGYIINGDAFRQKIGISTGILWK